MKKHDEDLINLLNEKAAREEKISQVKQQAHSVASDEIDRRLKPILTRLDALEAKVAALEVRD